MVYTLVYILVIYIGVYRVCTSGEVGARGVIFDPGGKIVNTFSWGLRTKTNNEEKWLELFQGLEMIN